MAKKKTAEKASKIDNILFNCRDILRAARNSGSFFEKRDMMLTLVFLRFIGEKYEDGTEKLRQTLIDQGLDPEDEKSEQLSLMMQPLRMARIIWRKKRDGQPSSRHLHRDLMLRLIRRFTVLRRAQRI